jgi:uncharacterized protein YjcR
MDLESNTAISNDGGEMPGSRTFESWQWSPSKETAASLVAEGRLHIYEIAQQVGVSEKTIDRWKKRPAFRARVDAIVTDFRNQLFAESLRWLESRFAVEKSHAKWAKRRKLPF